MVIPTTLLLKEKKLKNLKKQLRNWYLKINSLMSTTHIQQKKAKNEKKWYFARSRKIRRVEYYYMKKNGVAMTKGPSIDVNRERAV